MSLNAVASPAAREPKPLMSSLRAEGQQTLTRSGRLHASEVNPVLGLAVAGARRPPRVVDDISGALGTWLSVCSIESFHRGKTMALVLGAQISARAFLAARCADLTGFRRCSFAPFTLARA